MFETRRLRLRRIRPSDEPTLVALDSDPEVMRYIGSRGATPEEIVERVHQRIGVDHGPLGWWVIEGRSDGAFHGVAALLPMPTGGDVELAYRLARASWGRGIATEAAGALVGHAFLRAGLARLVAVTFPENVDSRRVLEKLGFVHDGMDDYKGFRVAHFVATAGAGRPAACGGRGGRGKRG